MKLGFNSGVAADGKSAAMTEKQGGKSSAPAKAVAFFFEKQGGLG